MSKGKRARGKPAQEWTRQDLIHAIWFMEQALVQTKCSSTLHVAGQRVQANLVALHNLTIDDEDEDSEDE